jgi:hypothetical protein
LTGGENLSGNILPSWMQQIKPMSINTKSFVVPIINRKVPLVTSGDLRMKTANFENSIPHLFIPFYPEQESRKILPGTSFL